MPLFSFLKSKLALLLASTLLFALQCHAGYAVQDDCKLPNTFCLAGILGLLTSPGTDLQREFIHEAFAYAHNLVNLARPNTVEGHNADASQVFKWLYGTQGVDLTRTSMDMALKGIAENTTPVEGEPQGGGSSEADVRVYCNYDRLRQGRALANGERRMFDPEIKEFLKAKFDCSHALAWVMVPDKGHDVKPDTLQLCPWFLDYSMQKEARFLGQFEPSVAAQMIKDFSLEKLTEWALYTPIDTFQLFDKAVIHELAHTRRGQKHDDVGGFSGYGWKNCRKLSTKRGKKSPHRNADTLALFATISGLIETGGMVREDGTFVEGPGGDEGGAARRRSAPVLDAGGGPAPLAVVRRASEFNATSLKGRPLF